MIDLTSVVDDYLTTRRALGYKLEVHRLVLYPFVAHLATIGAEHITIDNALRWAAQPSDAPVWVAGKISIIRVFARYLMALDPATEVPPVGLLPEPSHRIVPHIYSDEDLRRVLIAADHLLPEHRADTYRQRISLVAVTGMRVGENVRLDGDDIDWERGLLTIVQSKFGKSRQIQHHRSAGRLRRPAGCTTTQTEVGEFLHLEHRNTPPPRQREHRVPVPGPGGRARGEPRSTSSASS